MSSVSLQKWKGKRAAELDRMKENHATLAGTNRGKRAMAHVNQAYTVLLASHFQAFCRDLHDECTEYLVKDVTPQSLQATLSKGFTTNRKLNYGNAQPGAIGDDFNRFGFKKFVDEIKKREPDKKRFGLLEELNKWRNAIAHQDFDPEKLNGQTALRLGTVQRWRSACNGLAKAFDRAMRLRLRLLSGVYPW